MRRFVATRDLKALRSPSDSPLAKPLGDGTFIAVYRFERGQLGPHCDWGFPETARLAGTWADARRPAPPLDDLLRRRRYDGPRRTSRAGGARLAHPSQGLIMIWTSADADHERSAAALRDALVAEPSAIGSVISFRPALPPNVPQMPGAVIDDPSVDDATVMAHCCFVDTVPMATGRRCSIASTTPLTALPVTPLLVAPFIPTVPGTRHLPRPTLVTGTSPVVWLALPRRPSAP